MDNKYIEYTLGVLKKLLAIPSPTSYTEKCANFVADELKSFGYKPKITNKNAVICDIGGSDTENAILVSAHIDTLGAMVRAIKPNGRLSVTPLGGLCAANVETETVHVLTRAGASIEGTFQLENASVHVNGSYRDTVRSFDNVEIVLDDDAGSAEATKALGIAVGDIVSVEPRTVITEKGYIKSRFLDDKLSAAMLLGFAKFISERKITTARRIYLQFTTYEELGHGAAQKLPEGVSEILGVDMGCVGDGLECTEKMVSICAACSAGPSDYGVTGALIDCAKAKGLSYAVDVYPHYSSDCDVAVRIYDIKHALIGAGVYASHGYERSHTDGVKNTLALLEAYLIG